MSSAARLAIVAAALLVAPPAYARVCGPLRQVALLAITSLPGGMGVTVPIAINGKTVHLLIDTGAGASGLTERAAARLGLPAHDSGYTRLQDGGGHAVHRYYIANGMTVGTLSAHNIPFLLEPRIVSHADGRFGPDLMVRYDMEMDFAADRLIFFSQDHCPGHIVHWLAGAVAQVPIKIVPRAHDYPPPGVNPAAGGFGTVPRFPPILGIDIRTSVTLDGHTFAANIDTGSAVSTINSQEARRYFDVSGGEFVPISKVASETPIQAGNKSGSTTESITVTGVRAEHRFHTMTFGGVTVINPLFVLHTKPAAAERVNGPRGPDVTIGMDILSKLHMYFAFGEQVLYVSSDAKPTPSSPGRYIRWVAESHVEN